jgi:CBS domain-containing protein
MSLLASDVMINDVVVVSESTPLKEVAKLFSERRITGAPVVNAAVNWLESFQRPISSVRAPRSEHGPRVRQVRS